MSKPGEARLGLALQFVTAVLLALIVGIGGRMVEQVDRLADQVQAHGRTFERMGEQVRQVERRLDGIERALR